ncbi:MAG: HrpE/YscL family type III secretion apparatus protein [Pseudomonadota bacterium]
MRRIRLIDPSILPDGGVLRADQVRALCTASDVIDRAEAWAAERDAAQSAHLEQARAEATERAYADGISALLEASAAYRNATQQLQAKLTDLLRDCLGHVFRERPAEDVLHAAIRPVLSSITIDEDVAIVVHPSRVPALEAALVRAAETVGKARIGVETDPSLRPEDCRIYTDAEVINAGAEVITERLITALSDHLAGPTAKPAPTQEQRDGG